MRFTASRLRIIVLGYLVRGPLGGLAWHHLQYVLGLARLGHDVYFCEDSDDFPGCYDPVSNLTGTDPAYGLHFVNEVFSRLGLAERWCYYDAHADRWHGPAATRVSEMSATSDILLNLSGVNPIRDRFLRVPVRALVDTDPAFTQIRHLTDPTARLAALRHTVYFTYGENYGRQSCLMPDDGLPWQATRQPVVLDVWTPTPGRREAAVTSVMVWNSYAPAIYKGKHYGMKATSFAPYLGLPGLSKERFELALGSPAAVSRQLTQCGWAVLDSRSPTIDPWTYQTYIARSKAEFSVAKHGYVQSRSGWFSERSAAYLASGRPVVVEDTGFSEWLAPAGGVLPFSSPEEALERLADVDARYDWHCQQARAVAESYFGSDRVLTQLLERAVAGTPNQQPVAGECR